MKYLSLTLLLVATTARAQPVDPDTPQPSAEFMSLVQTALEEFGLGNYTEAADTFRAAYAIRPSARVLRGLGKAYFENGRYVAAADAFERSLVTPLDALSPPMQEEVETLLVRAERHIGRLQITVEPADAQVKVDGIERRTTSSIRLDEGIYRVEASHPDREPFTTETRITAGELQTVELSLPERTTPTIVHESPNRAAPIGFGVLAAAGATTAVAASIWLVNRIQANNDCDSASGGTVCSNHQQISTEQRAAAATVGIGAAMLVGGVVGVLLTRPRDHPETACAPAPNGFSCLMRGTF